MADPTDRGTSDRGASNRLTGPALDPAAFWRVEGASAIPRALAAALGWQIELERAAHEARFDALYPLAKNLLSAWAFLLDQQDTSPRDPRDGALLVYDPTQVLAQSEITIELVTEDDERAIPVATKWKEPPLPVWAPSSFPPEMPASAVTRYPKRPRDIGEIPPFMPELVRRWSAIVDRGEQAPSKGKAKGKQGESDFIPIVDRKPAVPDNEKELQAALDQTMKKISRQLVDVKVAALGLGSAPGVTGALKALAALTANDLSQATGTRLKLGYPDRTLLEMTQVVLYHSVYTVVLDRNGEVFDLEGRLDYPILVQEPSSQMQRNLPPPGVYVSVLHYGDGNFRILPRPVVKRLHGGVGSFTEYGYGASSPHEFQQIIQKYMDWSYPAYIAALSVSSAFNPDSLSTANIGDKLPPLVEQSLAATFAQVEKRLEYDIENYRQFIAGLARDIVEQVIMAKIREEIEKFVVEKLGAKVVPLVNVAFAVYDILQRDDIAQVRHALAAMILAIQGREPDDVTVAAKVLGKIVGDRVYGDIRSALVQRGAKLAAHAVAKARAALSPPTAAPAPPPPAPPAAEPPTQSPVADPTAPPDEPAPPPPAHPADAEKHADARGTQARGTDETASTGADAASHDPLHAVGTRIRGEDEVEIDDEERGTDDPATTPSATATGKGPRRQLVERGKPATPRSTGDPLEFQTKLGKPQYRDVGGARVVSMSDDALIGSKNPHYRADVAAVIAADPHHPMRALLDPATVGTDHPAFVVPAHGTGGTLEDEIRRHPEQWEAGHMRSGHAGDANVLVVQSRYRNKRQSLQETGGGEVTHDSVVVIGHIPVEGQTAWDMWHAGYIDLSFDEMNALPRLDL